MEIKTWKQYNEGISMEKLILLPDEIKSDIMDICLELTDNGFEVEIIKNDEFQRFVSSNSYDQLLISKSKTYIHDWNAKQVEQVKEVIERIEDYLQPLGYETTKKYLFKHIVIYFKRKKNY